MLTKKQNEFLNKLKERYENEPLPSFKKICIDLGFKSKNSIWQYLKKLIEEGFIKEVGNRFFIPQEGTPYFESGVRAGFPSPAEDYMVQKISFDALLVKKPASTFSVKVLGDSMIEAGIHEGDIAIVEKGIEPKNGDTVVAMVDGDFTLKYYWKKNGEILLEPANSAYKTIRAKNELQIFGVATGLIRKLKN